MSRVIDPFICIFIALGNCPVRRVNYIESDYHLHPHEQRHECRHCGSLFKNDLDLSDHTLAACLGDGMLLTRALITPTYHPLCLSRHHWHVFLLAGEISASAKSISLKEVT